MDYETVASGADQNESLPVEISFKDQPWYKIWLKVITWPSMAVFSQLEIESTFRPRTGFVWLFGGFMLAQLISVISNLIVYSVGGPSGSGTALSPADFTPLRLVAVLIAVPVYAVIYGLIFAAVLGAIHGAALIFGGQGSYSSLIFIASAFAVPIAILQLALEPTPVGSVVTFLLPFYNAILTQRAIRAAYAVSAGRSLAITSSLSILVVCLMSALAFVFGR